MIIWVMGLLLIASFVCFVIYAMKGGNLTIGFFILTIVWTLVYFLGIPFGIGKPFNVIEETFAQPALTSVVPNNEMILAIAVCILAPLALFRGPLELYGAGSAVISILMGMGVFNAWFLFALLVVPSMTCISSCVTQSWNMWAVEYNELEPKTFLKNGVPVYWLCTFPIMGLASLLLF